MHRLYAQTAVISSLMMAFLLSSTAHAATTQVSSASSPQTFSTPVSAYSSVNFTGSFDLTQQATLTFNFSDSHSSSTYITQGPPLFCAAGSCLYSPPVIVTTYGGIDYDLFSLYDNTNTLLTGTVSTLFNGPVNGLDNKYNYTYIFSNLNPGQYTFNLYGYAYSAGNASFSVATVATPVTTPVPEPESLGLLLAGLGIVTAFISRNAK